MITRSGLIAAITTFLSAEQAYRLDEIRAALEQALDDAGPGPLARLSERLIDPGDEWGYYPPDALARHIHHVLADSLMTSDSMLLGLEHIAAIAGTPTVIFGNHLSYSDANLLEVLLSQRGGAEVADRLTVVAGPKVYSSLQRRFSSLCFGTIRTPQNSAVSSEDAVMNAREVARAARQSIEAAHARLSAGDTLVVFGEGTRSRTQGMQSLLAGASRYMDGPDVWVLPVGITGTEGMFPIGDDTLHPVTVVGRIGPAFPAATLLEHTRDDRRLAMDVVGLAIAQLLPSDYRGAYADDSVELETARQIWTDHVSLAGATSR